MIADLVVIKLIHLIADILGSRYRVSKTPPRYPVKERIYVYWWCGRAPSMLTNSPINILKLLALICGIKLQDLPSYPAAASYVAYRLVEF